MRRDGGLTTNGFRHLDRNDSFPNLVLGAFAVDTELTFFQYFSLDYFRVVDNLVSVIDGGFRLRPNEQRS